MGGRDGGGTTSKAGGSAEGKNCEIGLLLLMENMLHQLMTCFINNMYIPGTQMTLVLIGKDLVLGG